MPTSLPSSSTGAGTVPAGVTAELTVGGSTTTLTVVSVASSGPLADRLRVGNLPSGAVDQDLDAIFNPVYQNVYIYIPSSGAFAKVVRAGGFLLKTEAPIDVPSATGFQLVTCRDTSFSIINIGAAAGSVASFSADGTDYAPLAVGESNDVGQMNTGRFVNAWAYDATGTEFKFIESKI